MDYSKHLAGGQIELPLLERMGLIHSSSTSRVSWHSHPGFEILFLLDGRTAYEFKSGGGVELQGGQFMVVSPQTVHRGRHDMRAPCRICGLALNPLHQNSWRNTSFVAADITRLRASLTGSANTVHPLNPALRWIIRQLMQEAGADPTLPKIEIMPAILRSLVCAAILEAVRQIISPPQAPKAIIAAAVAYLEEHYHEEIAIGHLAGHLGYSRSRVHGLFKSETGLSPNDYLQRLRIEKAQALLRSATKSVTEIALETGFNSGQYFCTVFRRYTGVTPAGYRKSLS
jgi:AraC-like DNA-binding protein/mannose-6-phosphate isomerase-like protein (cupin superfamily)